jgi:phosphatidylcholine synthase
MTFAELRAFGVHIFTACGSALALLALVMATGGHWTEMFMCLGLSLLVDGVDGPLARTFKVSEVLPRWSGATLDMVVDFVTYVFVPAFAIAASGLLPDGVDIAAGISICISGTLYFGDREMKTHDNYFKGFPVVWNLVAFYLYVFQPPPWLAALGIFVLVALTFVPISFVHPLRVKRLRVLNIALLGAWGALALLTLASDLQPGPYVSVPLAAIALYFLGAGLLRGAD